MPKKMWVTSGLAAVAVLAAGCGGGASSVASSSGSAPPPPSPSASPTGYSNVVTLKSMHTKVGTVLATLQGSTLYWYAADTPGKSKCIGVCAYVWLPLGAPAVLVPGLSLPGKLGTIARPGGGKQTTYDGHPLYAFARDRKPGLALGDGVDGVWHAMKLGGR